MWNLPGPQPLRYAAVCQLNAYERPEGIFFAL